MPSNGFAPLELLERLRRYDTCTLSNAIERLNLRPRSEGYICGAARSIFHDPDPVIGYAVTGKTRSSMQPARGLCYYQHIDWWKYIASHSGPLIVVLEDVDPRPAHGALMGEAAARICRRFGCVAAVTNGAVRDIPNIEKIGFQLFADSVCVSHAYSHVVEFGGQVQIGGVKINPGDLLHGDIHGVHLVPRDAIARLPALADEVLRGDHELFELVQRDDFSIDSLEHYLAEESQRHS